MDTGNIPADKTVAAGVIKAAVLAIALLMMPDTAKADPCRDPGLGRAAETLANLRVRQYQDDFANSLRAGPPLFDPLDISRLGQIKRLRPNGSTVKVPE